MNPAVNALYAEYLGAHRRRQGRRRQPDAGRRDCRDGRQYAAAHGLDRKRGRPPGRAVTRQTVYEMCHAGRAAVSSGPATAGRCGFPWRLSRRCGEHQRGQAAGTPLPRPDESATSSRRPARGAPGPRLHILFGNRQGAGLLVLVGFDSGSASISPRRWSGASRCAGRRTSAPRWDRGAPEARHGPRRCRRSPRVGRLRVPPAYQVKRKLGNFLFTRCSRQFKTCASRGCRPGCGRFCRPGAPGRAS